LRYNLKKGVLGMVKKKQKTKIIIALVVLGILLGVGYGVYSNSKLPVESKQVNKADSNTEQQKQAQETITKNETVKNSDSTSNEKLTSEKATEIIKNLTKNKYPDAKVVYDHQQSRDGKNYFVIHVYDYMPDQQSTSTIGWYYVEVNAGKAYEWDLITDKLTPIN
jgi:Tfp pilus assembly protein PilE